VGVVPLVVLLLPVLLLVLLVLLVVLVVLMDIVPLLLMMTSSHPSLSHYHHRCTHAGCQRRPFCPRD
jgi:hypothetical protein